MRSDEQEAQPKTDRPPTRTVRRFVERGGRLLEVGAVERETRAYENDTNARGRQPLTRGER